MKKLWKEFLSSTQLCPSIVGPDDILVPAPAPLPRPSSLTSPALSLLPLEMSHCEKLEFVTQVCPSATALVLWTDYINPPYGLPSLDLAGLFDAECGHDSQKPRPPVPFFF